MRFAIKSTLADEKNSRMEPSDRISSNYNNVSRMGIKWKYESKRRWLD
jgi:hypothetical protein